MPPPDYRHQSAGTLSSTAHPAFGNDHGHFRQGIDAAPRPWTVPTSQASYSLDSLLPPRRELPFGNPTTTTTGPTSKSTIITTGDEATNAMPKAAAADKAGARGAKQPAKTKGRTAKPLQAKKGKNNPRKEVVDSNVETPAELSSTQTPGTMSGVVTESHSTVPAMPSATRAEVGSSSRKRPLTELEAGPNNGRQPGLSTSRGPASDNRFPTQPDRIQAAQPPVNPETVSAEYLDRIDAFVAQHASRPPPPEAANDSLAAYAAQSDEDRLASIDDLICQHLMDDDFLQLCEDVENSWRRIGLGR